MLPKKRKSIQPTLQQLISKKSNVTEEESVRGAAEADESKQHVLIDLTLRQAENETGCNGITWFNFHIHFIDTDSQQIGSEHDVENQNALSTASTSNTAMETDTEEDNYDFNGDDSDESDSVIVGDGKSIALAII